MNGGWSYRVAGVAGAAVLTASVLTLVNNASVLEVARTVPVVGGLPSNPPRGQELVLEVLTGLTVILVAFLPLFKPRPRRILDIVALAQKRVLLAMVALAAIGYFDYTYRLPRLTVILSAPLLLVVLPVWFVYIRRRPSGASSRTVVVGDDLDQIRLIASEYDWPLLGYLAPTSAFEGVELGGQFAVTDGGLERLGGLTRIEDVFVEHDVDTAILAFRSADRAEFFGVLDACFKHGVSAKVHRNHADSVLTSGEAVGTFLDVDIEPWDVQDYVMKRAFDVAFSLVGLLTLAPVAVLITLAIKLDDGGPVIYRQERTAVFGETFDVYKFRTMAEDAEDGTGPVLSAEDSGGVDARVSRLGRILRETHLDEIPQLWSVLTGAMSVVGPRPERPELDPDMRTGVLDWRKRWFVKPGLTGLAQVNGVSGFDPERKLRYDLEYVRRQSFWFDLKIVVRQLWIVAMDVTALVNGGR